jgi:hypothetical protein
MSPQTPVSSARDEVRQVVPKLIELTETLLFPDIWERPASPKRDRSLITVAPLCDVPSRAAERPHHERALANGVTKERSRLRARSSHPTPAGRPPESLRCVRRQAGLVRRRSREGGIICLGTMGPSMAFPSLQTGRAHDCGVGNDLRCAMSAGARALSRPAARCGSDALPATGPAENVEVAFTSLARPTGVWKAGGAWPTVIHSTGDGARARRVLRPFDHILRRSCGALHAVFQEKGLICLMRREWRPQGRAHRIKLALRCPAGPCRLRSFQARAWTRIGWI